MKCDIIIPVWNEPQLTKDCIDSIIKNTHYPYRLIIIDNGSQQETKGYLEALKKKEDIELTLIRNEENLGFVRAINQGIKSSDASYVCILNNDTLVAEGWLEEMINVVENNPKIGIINPSSNSLGQYLSKGESIESYAASLKKLKGQWGELGQCSGFCMLIKREVIEKVGLFDEIFQIGYYEETDFCRKAQKLEFIFARAKAAYVYHKEKASFRKWRDWKETFRRNQKIFCKRWGRQKRILYVISKYDEEYYQRIENESINLARENNWVWIFLKDSLKNIKKAEHSNLVLFRLPERFFLLRSLWIILKRKKKFNHIFIDDQRLFNILNKFKFLHKAKIKYIRN